MSRGLRAALRLFDSGGISEKTLSFYLAAMLIARGEPS